MPHLTQPRRQRRSVLAVSAALMLAALMPVNAGAAPQSGFKTSEPSMLALGADSPIGMTIKPIITVGDMFDDYRYESIPDGISITAGGKNAARVFVNHETSTVPFRFNASPTVANSENDFENSMVSDLVIHKGGAVLSGELIIESNANFQRFCSNFLATSATGFDRPILFNNEEGIDWVKDAPATPAWDGNLENVAGAHQIGAVVAYDVQEGEYETIWGMGRFNHENNVGIPGYDKPVLLSGDDAFVSNPAQSQVYAYIADDRAAVMADAGDLWAFVPDPAYAAVNDYYDFGISGATGATDISGHFIKVPKEIATGKDPDDGSEMISNDVPAVFSDGTLRGDPYLPPPTDGTWQRPPGAGAGVAGIDGPQWILETWSDRNNVFQFTRIEDIATDKRPGMSKVVYLADSGRGATSTGGNAFTSSNGRIWKMVFHPTIPTIVTSMTILIEGDDAPVKTLDEIHQPDNLETTVNGLYITEDPGSSQQFPAGSTDPLATTARLWQYKFSGPSLGVVAKVDQSADEGPTDEDGSLSSAGNWGAWETTGILDVSAHFGPGKFLINVQAHTLWIDVAAGPTDIDGDADPDWTVKREGGQLLLITIPGG